MKPARGPAACLALLLLCVACGGVGRKQSPPPTPVPVLDLERYLGRWYEIASYPNRFQRDCVGTTATYTARDDGRIGVRNHCWNGSFDGPERSIEGTAWAVAPGSARLEVQFFWPFRGDYWVIALDPDYRWAVVGHPARRYLWILSRTPALDDAVYAEILRQVEAQGYDTGRISRTPQPTSPPPPEAVP